MFQDILSMNLDMAQVGDLVNGLAEVGMDAVANINNLNATQGSGDLANKSGAPAAPVNVSSPKLTKKSPQKPFQPEPSFGLHCLEFSTVIGEFLSFFYSSKIFKTVIL